MERTSASSKRCVTLTFTISSWFQFELKPNSDCVVCGLTITDLSVVVIIIMICVHVTYNVDSLLSNTVTGYRPEYTKLHLLLTRPRHIEQLAQRYR